MIQFKEPRLLEEWETKAHPMLRAVVMEAEDFATKQFNSDMTITCIVRTPEENAADGGLPQSAHLTGRAADIRLLKTSDQCQAFVEHLVKTWGPIVCALVHNGGTGPHIHVNVNKGSATPWQIG